MTTRQEGYGCSSVKLGSFVGATKGMMTLGQLHSQCGESIGENMSPRSVLEHRALSGLAIAINLEEKKNKSSQSEHHIVFSRYCCKQNIHLMGAGQEANSQHNLALGSFLSRERLTHMIHKERETASNAPIVGLRMVASLYPLLHLSNPEPKKRRQNLVMGRSVSIERVFMEAMRYNEQQKHSYVRTSAGVERKQGNACDGGMKVSMSSSPPLQNEKNGQPITCKSNKAREYGPNEESFLGGRSTEESIFYYVNPSSSDTSHTAVDADLSCSPTQNFLKICTLCKCLLGVGKDIYMYRGDQAFCSAECRYQQIMIDECMDL